MKPFDPERLYIEKGCEKYFLGRQLMEKYADKEMIWVDDHNKIPELRERPDSDFPKLKRYLVLGIRKSLAHQPNNKTSDFLVPYTSSGCSAMCLYCYLVCTYYKSAYLRVFVNREAMMDKLKRAADKFPGSVFEIGSNSDLVLENSVSGNLEWTIKKFRDVHNARLTLPTKFDMVDPLLDIDHGENVTIRMSLNPSEIIRRVEFGTSNLQERIAALNKLYRAHYDVGILVAPIILLEGYEALYEGLFQTMAAELDPADTARRAARNHIHDVRYGPPRASTSKPSQTPSRSMTPARWASAAAPATATSRTSSRRYRHSCATASRNTCRMRTLRTSYNWRTGRCPALPSGIYVQRFYINLILRLHQYGRFAL